MASNNGKSSLFIGDLAIFCSEREIEEAFSPYGEIQEIKIMRSEETSRNLSYGFIKFSSALSAKRAMTELNGVILCGRPLRIRWATYKSKVGSKEPKQDVLETSPVHVSFISYQIDKLVTEESLRELFSKYGLVVDASIKKSMIDTDVRRQSGYGFVHYSITGEGIHAAIRAASSLDDITVESVNYKCSLSHNLNKYLTGELSMPAEDSQIPGRPANSMPMQHGGAGSGYQEDLGLVDSDQFFHSPPQTQQQQMYNVQLPPPGAGPQLYRPGGNNPSQMGLNNGVNNGGYQSQFLPSGNGMYPHQQQRPPQQQQQQQLPKYVSQVPQAARNRPLSVPPQQQQQQMHGGPGGRPRSMNGYQDLQNQLQQGYNNGRIDQQQQYGGRYENQQLDSRYLPQQQQEQGQNGGMYNRQSNQQNYGNNNTNMNNNNMYEVERDPHQQLQGVFARGNMAQQRGAHNNSNISSNTSNLLSAAVSGAFHQQQHQQQLQGQSQYSHNSYDRPQGSNTHYNNNNLNNNQFQEHLGNIGVQGQLRSGLAPPGYKQQQQQSLQQQGQGQGQQGARVVSAPNLMGAAGQNGAGNNASNRWSTGSYNVTSPSSSPSSVMPSVMPPQPPHQYQGRPLPVGKPSMQGQGQFAPGPNTNYNNNGSNNGYNQPQNNYNNNNFTNDLNANFNNLNLQSQHTMSSQFSNAYPLNNSMYGNNGNNNNNVYPPGGLVVLSPPPSPLQPYGASPLMGNATLFNPFQQGFSPLFTSVQGQLSPYVAAPGMPGMSPLLSPGQLLPRDVTFEENMSNVHNLFTPATAYYQGSPVMPLNDVHYSPAMFQGNFTTAPSTNGFGSNDYANTAHNNANNANAQFEVRHYANQRKAAAQKSKLQSSSSESNPTSPTATSAAASKAVSAAAEASATGVPAEASTVAAMDSAAPATATGVPVTAAAPEAASPESFFAHLDEGSPLEPESTLESDLGQGSELDNSPASTEAQSLTAPPGMSAVAAGVISGGNASGVAESPSKGVGARRSMIMKHAKQLMA